MKIIREAFYKNKINIDGVDYIIYNKVHGQHANVAANSSHTFTFTIPYALCKMTGIEIVYNVVGDANLKVKVPDGQGGYILEEQYGHDVNYGDVYIRESGYAATLQAGIELECVVKNDEAVEKVMGVNFILHELRVPTV